MYIIEESVEVRVALVNQLRNILVTYLRFQILYSSSTTSWIYDEDGHISRTRWHTLHRRVPRGGEAFMPMMGASAWAVTPMHQCQRIASMSINAGSADMGV